VTGADKPLWRPPIAETSFAWQAVLDSLALVAWLHSWLPLSAYMALHHNKYTTPIKFRLIKNYNKIRIHFSKIKMKKKIRNKWL
jgi:hypothetical protein